MPRIKRNFIAPIPLLPGTQDYANRARPEIFLIAFVQRLANDFKIDAARTPELKRLLEGWADTSRIHKARLDDWPRPREIKAALELVRSQIECLRETLEKLHPETEERFWAPEGWVGAPPFSEESVTTSPYGHRFFKVATGAGKWVTFHIDQERHFESLAILRNYAQRAIEELDDDEGGRHASEALAIWVHNVRGYWESVLGRKFTLKLGTAFCIAAFKPIDPRRSTEKRIVSTIRHVLKIFPPPRTRTPKK